MKRLDHRTMLNWGRRAGLNTRELYSAMTGGRFTLENLGTGDGNGFVTDVGHAGKRTYRPNGNTRNN